jgi:NSS family neurotransmitter:Na+ symporter
MAAFGFDPGQGPGLTFVTMPAVFTYMPMGQLFAIAFFVLLLVAALTSSVSLLEVTVTFGIDEWKLSRKASVLLMASMTFILGIPSALSFGVLSHITIFGKSFFDLLDYTTSNLMMPVSGICAALFVGWICWDKVEHVFYQTQKPGWLSFLRWGSRLVMPVFIAWILIAGL